MFSSPLSKRPFAFIFHDILQPKGSPQSFQSCPSFLDHLFATLIPPRDFDFLAHWTSGSWDCIRSYVIHNEDNFPIEAINIAIDNRFFHFFLLKERHRHRRSLSTTASFEHRLEKRPKSALEKFQEASPCVSSGSISNLRFVITGK